MRTVLHRKTFALRLGVQKVWPGISSRKKARSLHSRKRKSFYLFFFFSIFSRHIFFPTFCTFECRYWCSFTRVQFFFFVRRRAADSRLNLARVRCDNAFDPACQSLIKGNATSITITMLSKSYDKQYHFYYDYILPADKIVQSDCAINVYLSSNFQHNFLADFRVSTIGTGYYWDYRFIDSHFLFFFICTFFFFLLLYVL